MKNKMFLVTAGFAAFIIFLTCFFYFYVPDENNQADNSSRIVALNEISRLVEQGDTESAQRKISELEKEFSKSIGLSRKDWDSDSIRAFNDRISEMAKQYYFGFDSEGKD